MLRVVSVELFTVYNCLKVRLDRFWLKQDLLYNFKATFSEPEVENFPSVTCVLLYYACGYRGNGAIVPTQH